MNIDLWSIDIGQNSNGSMKNTCLNEFEIARANRFKFPELAEKWAFTRQALREILAEYLLQSAETINFEIAENGKPWLKSKLENKPIYFNLSHSGYKALIAITSICEIGVDVEKQKNMTELEEIAKRFFSQKECNALLALPNSQRQAAFFRIWTRKEAVIKANGLGMSMPLDKFNVPITTFNDWIELVISNSCAKNGHYYIYDVIINKEYEAALCLYSDDMKLEQKPKIRYYDYQANCFK